MGIGDSAAVLTVFAAISGRPLTAMPFRSTMFLVVPLARPGVTVSA